MTKCPNDKYDEFLWPQGWDQLLPVMINIYLIYIFIFDRNQRGGKGERSREMITTVLILRSTRDLYIYIYRLILHYAGPFAVRSQNSSNC